MERAPPLFNAKIKIIFKSKNLNKEKFNKVIGIQYSFVTIGKVRINL